MKPPVNIVWFRQDLRLNDNPAFIQACTHGKVLALYIFDDSFKLGALSKIHLQKSLESLNASLKGHLHIYEGDSAAIFEKLSDSYHIENVFYNLCFEPWHLTQETQVKETLKKQGVSAVAFNSNYLWHPSRVVKEDGSYYKVFSAYKRQALKITPILPKIDVPKPSFIKPDSSTKLNLVPNTKWGKALQKQCCSGEAEAEKKLKAFISEGLKGYKEGRNFPAKNHVSHLSAHLHFGEMAPIRIYHEITKHTGRDSEHFISELIWREFSCYLLYHFPTLHLDNFNAKFDAFPWKRSSPHLKAWQQGQTGIPIVDAGMRQLWQTGYMHNRVRMIVASFLVKNLGLHWHVGQDWFWDCLFDADLANNSASWQWVAGSGADAAPYFRIFNPVLQGEKFDKEGDYTKKWVPELKAMPTKYLFKPWLAPKNVLDEAGVVLGNTYPNPVVDLATSRTQALQHYSALN